MMFGGVTPITMNWKHLCLEYDGELIIERGSLKKINFKQNPEEFKSLIAHEFSHIVHADQLVFFKYYCIWGALPLILVGVIVSTTNLFLLSIIVFILAFILSGQFVSYSRRKMEIRCDREAVNITKNPDALKAGLTKIHVEFIDVVNRGIGVENILMHVRRFRYTLLGNTHPKFQERLKYIDNFKRELSN